MDYQVLSDDELVRECAQYPCPEAWREFIRRFHLTIAPVVMRGCRQWNDTRLEVVEDLTQQTYLKLCANNYAVLKRYQPRHENSFRSYLRVVTINAVYDHFRKEHPIDENTVELNEATNAAKGGHNENEIFFREIDNILRQRGNGPQEEKERAIFWLYYRHGLTSKAIASIPAMNLTVKGVESCIFRLTVYVKQAVVKRKQEEKPGGIQAAGSF